MTAINALLVFVMEDVRLWSQNLIDLSQANIKK